MKCSARGFSCQPQPLEMENSGGSFNDFPHDSGPQELLYNQFWAVLHGQVPYSASGQVLTSSRWSSPIGTNHCLQFDLPTNHRLWIVQQSAFAGLMATKNMFHRAQRCNIKVTQMHQPGSSSAKQLPHALHMNSAHAETFYRSGCRLHHPWICFQGLKQTQKNEVIFNKETWSKKCRTLPCYLRTAKMQSKAKIINAHSGCCVESSA